MYSNFSYFALFFVMSRTQSCKHWIKCCNFPDKVAMKHKHHDTKTDKRLTYFFFFFSVWQLQNQYYSRYLSVLYTSAYTRQEYFFLLCHNAGVLLFAQRPIILDRFMTVGPGSFSNGKRDNFCLFSSFWYFLCIWSFSFITNEGRKYISFSTFNFRTLQR